MTVKKEDVIKKQAEFVDILQNFFGSESNALITGVVNPLVSKVDLLENKLNILNQEAGSLKSELETTKKNLENLQALAHSLKTELKNDIKLTKEGLEARNNKVEEVLKAIGTICNPIRK